MSATLHPLNVECPYCHAGVGYKCINGDGTRFSSPAFHDVRAARANAALLAVSMGRKKEEVNEPSPAILQHDRWRHYKGGLYLAVAVAETHEHNGDLDVVYISLTHGKYVTRPLRRDSRNQDAWMDVVMWPDGESRPRFVREREYPGVGRLFP